MSKPNFQWVVCKFGGTSVSSRSDWDTIKGIINTHRKKGRHPFLVCSAVEGISDQLEALLDEAARTTPTSTVDDIKARHRTLARDLGIDAGRLLSNGFERLDRLTQKAVSAESIPPRLRAAVLSTGELLSTRLGAAYLSAEGVSVEWLDARSFLRAQDSPPASPQRQYLSATCGSAPDPVLQAHLSDAPDTVYLTQGFIAGNALDETVLLGRGGSDTSAAYFAAKLEAERLEIWTDVPGLFTANPRNVPSARLLRRLGYDEAQEVATMGAKVLHPRCIDPVRRYQIPLHVRSTERPAFRGTIVTDEGLDPGPQVKAVSAKSGITAVSMDTIGMWQEVGFLANVFQIFKHHGLSVDLVATSEANVTVTLDPVANAFDPGTLDRLIHDLNRYCDAHLIESCAVVSLVGRHIRSLLGELGPAFEVFDEQKVHLVTQAASDLNFSFVVDEDQAPRLVRELHAQFFGSEGPSAVVGPQWRELFEADATSADLDVWWRRRREALLSLAQEETPRYVYDQPKLQANARRVRSLDGVDRSFYAVKANPHPEILDCLETEGLGFECVSSGELERVFEVCPDVDPDRILFQPNFAPIEEYRSAFDQGVHVTIDNVRLLEEHPNVFGGEEIFVRVDPGRGHGHHRHVRTAGAQSKFGVVPDDVERLVEAVTHAGASVVGLHVHVGSGIGDERAWADIANFLASLATNLSTVRTLNVGGGLGVPSRPSAPRLDLQTVDDHLSSVADRYPQYDIWMEPGRYLVADAGVLLARVTQTKKKGELQYVGLDTGMNSLLRPALYGAHHEIVNLTQLGETLTMTADVVGPICETGDVLGHNRRLPDTDAGDVLLVATTGAYGASMSNHYNLRHPAQEVLLKGSHGG